MATIDLGKIKQVWRGTYNNSTAYTVDDVVEYTDGSILSSYICVANSTGNAPSSGGTLHSSWNYLAKGAVVATNGLKFSGSNRTVYRSLDYGNSETSSHTYVTATSLTLPQLTTSCQIMVFFSENRYEQSWNITSGMYTYSTSGSASGEQALTETYAAWENSSSSYGSNIQGAINSNTWYHNQHGSYCIDFSSGQTPYFAIKGKRFGNSNQYRTGFNGANSIIAVIVES